MARQAEDQFVDLVQKGYLLGLDPGDVCMGVAGLHVTSEQHVMMESAVLSVSSREHNWKDLLDTLDWSLIGGVVCESFQIRPMGYNSFSAGQTLRLIGAIETYCYEYETPLLFVPPGAPADLNELPLYQLVQPTRGRWPINRRWKHCLSAWRVLALALARSTNTSLGSLGTSGIEFNYFDDTKLVLTSRLNIDDVLAPIALGKL